MASIVMTKEMIKRFEEKFERGRGCWEWQGATTDSGYGLVWRGEKRLNWRAHRVAWTIYNGDILPEELLVCHDCDNPPCVRPDHLFLGNHQDNALDAARKGRLHTKLTPEEVKEIRALCAQGIGRNEIARQYEVSGTLIRYIKERVWWQHV